MHPAFKIGDIAYLVESNRFVSKGNITYICGDIITFRFSSGKGGTKVKAHRLFVSEEAALASIHSPRATYKQHLSAIMA